MLRAVFPGWSNPLALVALLGLRVALNGYLTVTVASTVGFRAAHTAVVGTLTVVSGVLTVLLLRGSGLGVDASYAEVFLQIALISVAASVVVTHPSSPRRTVTVAVLLGALGLAVVMIPIYGEAFVAP